ncbi:MAG: efflux RND transporter permease subunit [Planctomycetia bacterium]|nr:efflux RND transporter permease subunit [Planctomycetia bacterium]
MVKLVLRQPYVVIVLVLTTVVLGWTALARTPVDILPQFEAPAVQIVTFYPGMPAEIVEQDISSRMQRWTGQSVGIERQEARSMLGVSIVKDFFREDVDPSAAIAQVTSYAMSDLYYLPPGTVPPMVMPFDPTASVPLCLLAVSSPTHDETALYDIAYFQLRNRLQSVAGVIAPAVYGGKLRRILTYLDRDRLASRGLAATDVVQALKSNNVFLPVGSARLGAIEYQLDTNALPATVEEMNGFPVTRAETAYGRQSAGSDAPDREAPPGIVYIRDVGDTLDSAELQSNIVRVDGRRQVYIPVYRQPGANTIRVVEGVKEQIGSLKAQLPSGVNLDVVQDQSVFVRTSIKDLVFEASLGAVLAAVMILLFLQSARSALFILITLPLTYLAAFLGLLVAGQTINVMTLGGLALATGMVLDEGIVAIENVLRHLEAGASPHEAALRGMGEMARPRLLITLTVVVVFFPVVFLGGLAQFLFAPLALAVALAMVGSYLFSMTIIPVCAARFLRPHAVTRESAVASALRRAVAVVETRYRRGLSAVLRRPILVLSGTAALLVGTWVVHRALGAELFPVVDSGQITIRVRAPSGTDVRATERLLAEVEAVVAEVVPAGLLEKRITNIGVLNDWPAAYTPNAGPSDAFVVVQVGDGPGRRPVLEYVRGLREALSARLPGLEFAFDTGGMLSAAVNMGAAAPIDIWVQGRSLERAQELAQEIRRRVASVPGAVDVRVQQRLDAPQYRIDVDREKAALLGVSADDVVKNVITSFTSSTSYDKAFWLDPGNGNHYFVGAQYPETAFVDRGSIEDVLVGGAGSRLPIPLKTVARLERATGASEVGHQNITRTTNVFANVEGRDLAAVASDVEAILEDLRREGRVPPGYVLRLEGARALMRTAFAGLGWGLAMASVLVYLVMVVQFRSFLDPFVVMFAVPLGFVGVVAALKLTGTHLSIQALVGVIMMIGIDVASSTLRIDLANRLRAGGRLAADAILEASVQRLRPILMTALAATLGLLPMAVTGGANAPLARAVVGGVLASTVLSMFVVPILYVVVHRRRAPGGES